MAIINAVISPDTSAGPQRSDESGPLPVPRPYPFELLLAGVAPATVLLASDFDGTLAPIVDRPELARALPAALDALRRLVPKLGRLLIVSGRSNVDLQRFLPIEGLDLRGDYGLGLPTEEELAALEAVAAELGTLLERHTGTWLERKPGSMTVHYRDAPAAAAEVSRQVKAVATGRGLRARDGRMVVELMPERADKATALGAEVRAFEPGAVIFAGDDTGDRACFELVASLPVPHLSVGVRSPEADPAIFERCDLVVEGPPAWADLLTQLAGWAGRH